MTSVGRSGAAGRAIANQRTAAERRKAARKAARSRKQRERVMLVGFDGRLIWGSVKKGLDGGGAHA